MVIFAVDGECARAALTRSSVEWSAVRRALTYTLHAALDTFYRVANPSMVRGSLPHLASLSLLFRSLSLCYLPISHTLSYTPSPLSLPLSLVTYSFYLPRFFPGRIRRIPKHSTSPMTQRALRSPIPSFAQRGGGAPRGSARARKTHRRGLRAGTQRWRRKRCDACNSRGLILHTAETEKTAAARRWRRRRQRSSSRKMRARAMTRRCSPHRLSTPRPFLLRTLYSCGSDDGARCSGRCERATGHRTE